MGQISFGKSETPIPGSMATLRFHIRPKLPWRPWRRESDNRSSYGQSSQWQDFASKHLEALIHSLAARRYQIVRRDFIGLDGVGPSTMRRFGFGLLTMAECGALG